MIKIFIVLLSLNMAVAGSLFDQYPYNDSVTLKDGTEVQMPFHVFSGTTTAVLGLNNSLLSRAFLWNHEWEPVSIPCQNNKGIAVLYLQHITDSTVGPYDESVHTYMVKRRGAPALNLPCLEDASDKVAVMQYILGALQIMGAANADKQALGLPHDYAMYNQHLTLDSQLAVDAGKEIWGYPKVLADVEYSITENQFSVYSNDIRTGRNIFELSYTRILSAPSPLLMIGDNVMPYNHRLHRNREPQLSGVLATHVGSVGYIMPFIGTYSVGNAPNLTSIALNVTQFDPNGIVEVTDLQGVAFPLYDKIED